MPEGDAPIPPPANLGEPCLLSIRTALLTTGSSRLLVLVGTCSLKLALIPFRIRSLLTLMSSVISTKF